jgi:chromosome segregation ATPase
MADDLDALIAKATQHIRDKKGELLALTTQIQAGRSAYDDLNKEISKTQDKLKAARDQLAESENQLSARHQDANKATSQILNAAQRAKVEADKVVKDAENKAKGIVAEAEARAYASDDAIRVKKAELQAVTNEVNAGQSELRALKKQALDFGNS